MRPFRLFTASLLMSGALMAPGWVWSQASSSDSLHTLLKQSRPDSNRVRLLLVLADSYQNDTKNESKSKLDTALLFARQAEALSRSLGFHQLIAQSLIAKSKALVDFRKRSSVDTKEAKSAMEEVLKHHLSADNVSQRAEATYLIGKSFGSPDTLRLPYLRSALNLFETLGDRRKAARIQLEMGETFRLVGNLQESLRMYLTALTIQESIHDEEISITLASLAGVYQRFENYPTALKYAYRAYNAALKSGDNNQIANSLRFLAFTFKALGDEKQVTSTLTRLLAIDFQRQNAQSIVRTRLGLAESLLRQGHSFAALRQTQAAFHLIQSEVPGFQPAGLMTLGDCYLSLRDYTTAERYFLKASAEMGGKPGANTYFKLGRVNVGKNQLTKASSFLKKALSLAQGPNLWARFKSEVLLELYRVDSIRNDPKAALAYYRQYITLKDSLFNETKSRQIAGLQIQFEVENKEKNIRLLQQRNAVQQSRLQQAQQRQISIIIGAFLLLLLLGITYNRYRLKQRSNQLLQTQQQQLQTQHRELLSQQEEISHKNADLQRLLKEKERLLKEIHHRVKNNLQVVMSLLNSQAASMQDKVALSAIQESQHRVQAMALIHHKLYQSEQIARIAMPSYIQEVVAYLRDFYDLPQSIRFQMTIDPIELDVTQAVPLGLIINEAITNALKYAFPGGRSGTVQVGLSQVNRGDYELLIADDGVGLSADFDPDQNRSLGMTLIRGFSEQLGGQLQIRSQSGLAYQLRFQEEAYSVSSVLS